MDAGYPGVNTLVQGARSIYCGAHRLPAGKTAARESSANVLPQAEKNFEGRLLQLSKALAPFVMIPGF